MQSEGGAHKKNDNAAQHYINYKQLKWKSATVQSFRVLVQFTNKVNDSLELRMSTVEFEQFNPIQQINDGNPKMPWQWEVKQWGVK